jgi:predicted extracellular nuclease
MRSFVLSVLLVCGLFACRGGDDDGETPDARRDGTDLGGMTIQEIQTPPGPGIGSPVELHGVVVTAVDRYGGRQGNFYVQEPTGGPYSGVLVFTANTSAVDNLEPGDVVSLTNAVVDEFAYMDPSGRTVTELGDPTGGMMTITETGTAEIPAPQTVDPRMLASSDDEAEKWEGVLIRLENVAVTQSPQGVSSTDDTLKEMSVSGPFRVGSSLAELADSIALNDCYASITGIGDYFYNYKVLHRSAADLVTGSGCPAQEEGATACGNGTDDDADGFSDCADFSCQATVPSCTMAAEITAIQTGTVPVNTRVRLENVIVTAINDSDDDKVIWVQDGAGAPNNGIAVFFGTTAIPAGLLLGDDVTLEGSVREFYMRTEVDIARDGSNNAVITKNATGTPVTPLDVTLATLATPSSAEPYEGVLVKVTNVSVVSANPDTPSDYNEWTVGTPSLPLRIGNDMLGTRPVGVVDGACYSTIAGVFDYNFSNYKIEPRSVTTPADVVLGAGCP